MKKDFLSKAGLIKTFTPELTFFNVAGYPHYENIVSNILKFFFSVDGEHGFGNLWLIALLNSYKKIAKEDLSMENLYNEGNIEREVYTQNGKRIDILIPLNEFVIIIENKIYSGVNNPFEEYHNEIKKRYPNKRIIEILLSINSERLQKSENSNFINITYDDLIEEVKAIKNKVNTSLVETNKWNIFMCEFIKNIENIKAENRMNKEWQVFIGENKIDFQHTLKNYFNDIHNKRNFLRNIKNEISELIRNKAFNEFEYNVYLPELQSKNEHFSVWVNVVNSKNEKIAIEAYINKKMPCELILTLWNRDKKRNADFLFEKNILSNSYLVEETLNSFWGKHLILKVYLFKDEPTAISVAKEILYIAEELKKGYLNL